MSADSKPSVRVKILDAEYAVTGHDDPEYLHQVASLVDRRMQLLDQKQKDMSPVKKAILTALNLADELLRTRRQLEQYQVEAANFSRQIAERSRKLVNLCAKNQL